MICPDAHGHDINLAVRKGLSVPLISRLFGKGHSLESYLYRSSSAKAILKEKQKILLDKQFHRHKLINDCVTLWNSKIITQPWPFRHFSHLNIK